MTVSQAQVSIHQNLKNSADKLLVFNWLQGQLEVDFFAMVKNKIFSLLFEANFWGSFALAKSIIILSWDLKPCLL